MARNGEARLQRGGGTAVGFGCTGLDGRVVEEVEHRGLEGRQSGVPALSSCRLAGQYVESRLIGLVSQVMLVLIGAMLHLPSWSTSDAVFESTDETSP
jgi:hypothetical protein